jgi:hypothetical protein
MHDRRDAARVDLKGPAGMGAQGATAMKHTKGRWALERLMSFGKEPEQPTDFVRIYNRIYRYSIRRSPSYGEAVADQKAGWFFARAWSIERARRLRIQRELDSIKGRIG